MFPGSLYAIMLIIMTHYLIRYKMLIPHTTVFAFCQYLKFFLKMANRSIYLLLVLFYIDLPIMNKIFVVDWRCE